MLSAKIERIGIAEGGISAQVEIVCIDRVKYVLKTDSEINIYGEKLFQRQLTALRLPHIRIFEHADLLPNQMLMEYVNADRLIGLNFTDHNLTLLGKTLATLHSKRFERYQALDQSGVLHPTSWKDFTNRLVSKASHSGYSDGRKAVAIAKVAQRITNTTPTFTLCHGDLHGNNVFVKNNELILFDNNADALVATPLYDLAILFGEVLPGYRYGDHIAQRSEDSKRMEAFLQGYNHLPDGFETSIDDYVFLRELSRYPNRFVKHQNEILKLILAKVLTI